MLKLCQLAIEAALEFKVRWEAAFRKIEDLEVTISNLEVISFLNGLLARFASIVCTLSVQIASYSLDDVLQQLNLCDI